MKKLMFALVAGVAATVATAAPITQADFEELAAGATVGVATNAAEGTWVGKFAYAPSGGSENTSTVAVYSVGAAYAGDRNAAFSDTNNNYLDLSTDGGILYSTINDRSAVNPFGSEKAVTSSLYIDTLVQFTVCDSAPEIDGDAKLAIWLQASDDETTTNLMVRAKTWAVGGDVGAEEFTDIVTNFAIGAANTYQAGEWYRLTVEAVPNVFSSTYGAAGFKIRINGNYVKADRAAFTGSTALVENMVADYNGLINAQGAEATIFLPINGEIASAGNFSPLTLCAVGFSGTGAVDDILFTEDNPFFTAPTVIDFTIALAANASVAYSFTSNAVEYAGNITAAGNTVLRVPVGATVSLTPTAATDSLGWYTYSATVENAVNAECGEPVEGATPVTIAPTFTQQMQGRASVEVNVSSTAVTKGDAAFANAEWNTGDLTAETFASLVAWAGARGYSTSRVANYPYALERMALEGAEDGKPGFPIEMPVYVATNELVAGYASSVEGQLANDEMVYTVDAGLPLTFSNFTYEPASSQYKAYKLDGDTESSNWDYNAESDDANTEGFTGIVVDPATSNSVVFTTDVNAAYAQVKIGVVEVVTASAVAKIGETEYYTLKDAIDAATAGQTVAVLADCTVDAPIVFNYGITVSNDYTVTFTASYAFRFANGTASPVTFCGSGTFFQTTAVDGSPFIVGNNETSGSKITTYGFSGITAGSVVMESGTVEIPGVKNNMIKVENGTFTMNGGTLLGGKRGVKADSENNVVTAEVIINGGVITNGASAYKDYTAICTSTGPAGSVSSVTINGGKITGKFDIAANTTATIPSTSTAQFDDNRSAYCVADYKTAKTAQSGDWYVVTPKVYYTAISLNKATTSLVTNETETLTATLTPAETADDSVTWTTSDASVATVEGGVVTAVGAGEATITVTATHDSTVTASCTVTVTAPAPTPELPVIPAGGETAEYASAEAAAEVAAAVNASEEAKAKAITPPASVAEGDKSTYYSYVQAVTAGNKVTVGFTTAGEAAARASANAATADADFSAAISDAAAAGASGSGTASVSSEPGLYYSIMSTGSLSTDMTEGTRVPGTGGKINLTVPNKGAAGFYKVKVSPRAAD